MKVVLNETEDVQYFTDMIQFNIIFNFMVSAILFEDAILLGAENDTLLYTTDTSTVFSLPFCQIERTVKI